MDADDEAVEVETESWSIGVHKGEGVRRCHACWDNGKSIVSGLDSPGIGGSEQVRRQSDTIESPQAMNVFFTTIRLAACGQAPDEPTAVKCCFEPWGSKDTKIECLSGWWTTSATR